MNQYQNSDVCSTSRNYFLINLWFNNFFVGWSTDRSIICLVPDQVTRFRGGNIMYRMRFVSAITAVICTSFHNLLFSKNIVHIDVSSAKYLYSALNASKLLRTKFSFQRHKISGSIPLHSICSESILIEFHSGPRTDWVFRLMRPG